MNKQEVIEKLESKAVNHYNETSGWTKKIQLDVAIDIINQLDEPEKPIVPEYIQTWIQGAKYNGYDLYETMNDWDVPNETDYWIQENPETFARAWLYGYEVEKEKLYTARLKVVTKKEYAFLNKEYSSGNIFIYDLRVPSNKYQVHFTQAELEELNVWDNPAFEIEEVEE